MIRLPVHAFGRYSGASFSWSCSTVQQEQSTRYQHFLKGENLWNKKQETSNRLNLTEAQRGFASKYSCNYPCWELYCSDEIFAQFGADSNLFVFNTLADRS